MNYLFQSLYGGTFIIYTFFTVDGNIYYKNDYSRTIYLVPDVTTVDQAVLKVSEWNQESLKYIGKVDETSKH